MRGPPEAVNALCVITDHHNIPVLFREKVSYFALKGVGVLVFINHDILILAGKPFIYVLIFQ